MTANTNRTVQTHLKHWQNQLTFSLRQWCRLQKSGFIESNDPFLADVKEVSADWEKHHLAPLFDSLDAQYHITPLKNGLSPLRWLETLTYLHHIDWMLAQSTINTPQYTIKNWLDIGCKNWGYVEAIHQVMQKLSPDQHFEMTGIELDAFRLYGNFHTRWDYAQTFIQPIPQAHYIARDVLQHQGAYDVISWFLPFVFEDPCLAWGLPLTHFKPKALLNHVVQLLKPNGLLLIVNQGADEWAEQQRLLSALTTNQAKTLTVSLLGALPQSFMTFQHSRYATVCQKVF